MKCCAITKKGTPCKFNAKYGEYCGVHNKKTNAPETCKKRSMECPIDVLKNIGNEQLELQRRLNASWVDAEFTSIQQLRPDYSGKCGEKLIVELCRKGGMEVEYNGDSNVNAEDGTYDAKICVKKDEIKTAWRGSNGSFQHESLRANGCDQMIFVDIAPNHYYITVLEKFDMTVAHPIIRRKPHLRKGTTDVYKFDFGEPHLQRAVEAGISIKVDRTTSMEDVYTFLKRFH